MANEVTKSITHRLNIFFILWGTYIIIAFAVYFLSCIEYAILTAIVGLAISSLIAVFAIK